MSDSFDISPRHVVPFGDTALTLTARRIVEHERAVEAFERHAAAVRPPRPAGAPSEPRVRP